MLKPWLELARVSNLPTVWTNVTAAWLISGGRLRALELLWLLLGGSLLYTAGMILNDAADLAFDREHKRERPIPSGRVSPAAAWGAGIAMMTSGAALMALPGGAGWPWLLGLVVAIVTYDLYHKPWPGSVWIMGACRSLLVLAVASANGSRLPVAKDCDGIGSYSVMLGLYIVALSMAARLEGSSAVPGLRRRFWQFMLFLPALGCLFRVDWPGLGSAWAEAGTGGCLVEALAMILILAAFIAMVASALRVMRQGGPHIGRAVGILLAGIPMLDSLFIVGRETWLALALVASFPLLRLWQRKIAAT